MVFGQKCFIFTLFSTNDIDKNSITSDFGRNSIKRGKEELCFLTIDAVNLDKIDQIRWKIDKFSVTNFCPKLSEMWIYLSEI